MEPLELAIIFTYVRSEIQTVTVIVLYFPFPASVNIPDSKVHGANMGPIWGRQDSVGPHVGPMNLAIWDGKGLATKK